MRRLLRLFTAFLTIYLLLVAAVFVFQREFLYHPFRASEDEMVRSGQRSRLMPWRDAAGAIIGWQNDLKAERAKARNKLLVLHGNAGHALYRQGYVAGFESIENGALWEVRVLEYPGYGSRTGSPSRGELDRAAAEAVKLWQAEDARPLYLLGESLGSGIACGLACSDALASPLGGLVLVTPYARLSEVAQRAIPFVPGSLLLRDRWDNIAALKKATVPVAFLIAGQDEVVGADQGEMLFESVDPKFRRKWLFADASHNTIVFDHQEAWWREVSDFLLMSASNAAPGSK